MMIVMGWGWQSDKDDYGGCNGDNNDGDGNDEQDSSDTMRMTTSSATTVQ